MLFCI